jgi:hypothetical protein
MKAAELLCSLVASGALAATAAIAQPPDAPPSLAAPPPAAEVPAANPGAVPRTKFELPAAERSEAERSEAERVTRAPARADGDELTPTAADAPQSRGVERVTRIEQTRRPGMVTEVVVTPADSQRSYVMTSREGRQTNSVTEATPGLSLPQLLRFDF